MKRRRLIEIPAIQSGAKLELGLRCRGAGNSRRAGVSNQSFGVFAVEEFRDRPGAEHLGQVRPGSVREGPVVPDRDQWAVA